jgi:hypothetical protein
MQPLRRRLVRALLPCAAIVTLVALTQHAQAQLSSAQQSALRSNCRSDFMSHCSGVTPGSKDALACLQKNVASLSPGCKTAVGGTMPPPAPAAPPPPKPAAAAPKPSPAVATAPPPTAAPRQLTAAQKDAMRASCRGDFMSRCSGVSPGGPEALACLQRNVGQLSSACKQVIGSTMAPPAQAAPKAAVRAAPAPAAAPPPPAAPVAAGPTPQQLNSLKFTCRRDFKVHCRGVAAGGQEAMACLVRNSARLTQNCRTSLLAIQESMPMPPPAASAPIPAAAAAAPAPPKQRATAVDAAVMLRACKRDMVKHCRGVDLGGGRMLGCLAAQGKSLSFRCRTALKVTSPLR